MRVIFVNLVEIWLFGLVKIRLRTLIQVWSINVRMFGILYSTEAFSGEIPITCNILFMLVFISRLIGFLAYVNRGVNTVFVV